MMHYLLTLWFKIVSSGGYLGVVLLMAMESSIFPVPSEVVIPPAAFLAAKGEMNIWGVIAAGTFGSWLGAAVTYWVAKKLGPVVIRRWGKYFLINEEKLERAERFMHRYEAGGIFFARLLPVVRHLISIPAGLVRMNFAVFSTMTVIGSAIWCSILAWYGHEAAIKHPDLISDPDKLVHAMKQEALPIVIAAVVLTGLYVLVMKLTAPKPAQN
jgi:membrane protein DedA with SNARE-associated domain